MTAFSSLGLSKYEESIYKSLLKLGRADAKKISDDSKVPPTAVYPNLKNLTVKGLVQKLEGEVATFEAIDPTLSLPALIERKKNMLEEDLSSAMDEAKNLSSQGFSEQKEPLTVSIGKEMSSQLFSSLAEKTRKEIYIAGWYFSNVGKDIALLKRMLSVKKSGKDIRLITNNPKKDKNWIIKEIIKGGIPVRYHPMGYFSIVIRDSEETKITLKNPKIGQRVNIHVEDPELSSALREYYMTLWKRGKQV